MTDEPPPGSEVVVALGREQPIRLRAEVVRRKRIMHQGREMHHIACRFTGRHIE